MRPPEPDYDDIEDDFFDDDNICPDCGEPFDVCVCWDEDEEDVP